MAPQKKQRFLDWNNKIFVESMKKIDKSIILIVILDMIFYFLCVSLVILWLRRLQNQINSFYMPSDIFALGYNQAHQLVGDIKSFYFMIILAFILLLLAIILLASIFKGIIWAITTKTKPSFKFVSKFLTLNLIWLGFWFFIAILIATYVQGGFIQAYFFSMILIALYLTNNLYSIYMSNQKLKSIIESLSMSFRKIHLFLLPSVVVVLIFYIVSRITSLMHFKLAPIVEFVIFISLVAIARFYFSTLATKIHSM